MIRCVEEKYLWYYSKRDKDYFFGIRYIIKLMLYYFFLRIMDMPWAFFVELWLLIVSDNSKKKKQVIYLNPFYGAVGEKFINNLYT